MDKFEITVNGLAFDPTTGKLYGSTSSHDPSYNGLIEIDLNTGAGTPVGVSGWGFDLGSVVTNITIDSTGQIFGWTEWTDAPLWLEDDLVSIDKDTGVASVVGESGIGTMRYGLSFDSTDTLYMVNYGGVYYTIDTATGLASYVGSLGTTAHHGDFDHATDLYYGLTNPWNVPKYLVVADLSTGTVISTIGLEDGNIHTLAFERVIDADEDGVLDHEDDCLDTPLDEIVDPHGCAISQLCPCVYYDFTHADHWASRAAYITCVNQAASYFFNLDLITMTERLSIMSEAAGSGCGIAE